MESTTVASAKQNKKPIRHFHQNAAKNPNTATETPKNATFPLQQSVDNSPIIQRFSTLQKSIDEAPSTYGTMTRGMAHEPESQTNLFSTLQLVRFPTQDNIGFKVISGVKVFDPSGEPDGPLAFVVLTSGGPIYTATGQQGRHPALYQTAKALSGYEETENKQSVYYAGMIYPIDGERFGWTNDSGHFIPTKGTASQAGLPMDRFVDVHTWLEEGFASIRQPMMDSSKERFIIPKDTITISLLDDIESDQETYHLSAGRKVAGGIATLFSLGLVWCFPKFRKYMKGVLVNADEDSPVRGLSTYAQQSEYNRVLPGFDDDLSDLLDDERV